MTEETRRENVRVEWEHATIAMGEVRKLMEGGFWAAAVSRAYYAAFYAARALLFASGLEARSHSGVINLLSLHFVRPGTLPAELVRAFSAMQSAREQADYQSAMVFDEQAARESLATAARFQEQVAQRLRADGFLPS